MIFDWQIKKYTLLLIKKLLFQLNIFHFKSLLNYMT